MLALLLQLLDRYTPESNCLMQICQSIVVKKNSFLSPCATAIDMDISL